MSDFYEDAAILAAEMLAEFGVTTTLTHSEAAVYNPATGMALAATSSQDVTAAFFDYGDKFIDGTRILGTDKRVLVSAVGITKPAPGDKLAGQGEDEGVSFSVVRAKSLAPAGMSVLYELQVRRG